MSKIITLAIDADILIYKTALASQQDGFRVVHSSFTETVTSMLAAKRLCKSKGLTITDVTLEPTKVLKKDYLKSAVYILHKMTNNIKYGVTTEIKKISKTPFKLNVIMCVGGPTNFRKDIPLFDKYKDRKDERPLALSEIKELIMTLYPFDLSDGVEADDRVSMYGFKGRKDMSYIAVTEDKDAKQTPMWLYIPRKSQLLNCEGFGEYALQVKQSVHQTTQKVKRTYKMEGHGRRWFYYQVVCGDPVDTYNPFSTPKVSDLKFYNIFKDLKTDKECWEKVFELFHARYGNLKSYTDWTGKKQKGGAVEILQNYVDVVHMQRFTDDRLNVREILSKYGII